jgi:predicted LPLAT superfamily acyltransferase
VKRCPFFVEPIFLAGYTAIFFLLCRDARRAIVSNLGVILPGSTGWANWWRASAVFWNFSESLTEAARVRNGEDVIEWEIEGKDYLQKLTRSDAGAILLTAHMGNYDVAARMFAGSFSRRVHAVRAPERQSDAQEQRRRELEGDAEAENLVIQYNESSGMLGVDLAKAIQDSEVVAIQGDRVLFGVAAVEASFDEEFALRIPKGPLVLGAMTGCQVYPVFL